MVAPNPNPNSNSYPPLATQPTPEHDGTLSPRRPAGLTVPRPPALVTKPPDALELLKALRRRWPLALALGLLCGGLAAAAAWFVVPTAKYETRAMLSVSQTPPRIIFPTQEVQSDFSIYKETQLALIKSPIVLNRALKDVKVRNLPQVTSQADPVAWLERQIEARYSGETLSISMKGDQPDGLAEFVNAVADAYLEEVVKKEIGERQKRYKDLEAIYEGYQESLTRQKDFIKQKADLIGTSDRDAALRTYELSMESRVLMERKLRELRIQVRESEAELEVLSKSQSAGPSQDNSGSMIPNSLIEQEIARDDYVRDLQEGISQLNETLHRSHRIAVRDDPSITRPQNELIKLQRQLATRKEQLRAYYVEQYQQRGPTGTRDDLLALQQRIEVLKKLEELTKADVAALSTATQTITTSTSELEELQRRLDLMETTEQKVGTELEVLKVELDAPSRVKTIQEARTPQLGADKRKVMAAGSGVGTLGLCLLGIAFLEFRSRRIGSLNEVVLGLGLPLVGSLPVMPKRPLHRRNGPAARNNLEWSNLLVDSVDAIRARLLHTARTESLRVIMVTSASSGEGKTSLSCHLATSLARSGRRTLLIDGDLRRPAVHRLLDLPGGPGFCELLRGEVDVEAVFQPASLEGLTVIAAGQVDARAIQALTGDDVHVIFDDLRSRFDFVVIDTSPILPVSDALLLGQHVDAAICSILRDVSRAPKVYAANERLLTLGVRILGAVVAGTRGDVYSDSYAYAYATQVKS